MLNEKSILVFFFFLLAACSQSFSQETEVFISDQKLDGIFNNNRDKFNKRIDNSILWEENYGIEFLLKKLDSQNHGDHSLAISFLSMSKDEKFIKIIVPYLDSSRDIVATSAVGGLGRIGTQECLSILEEKLLSVDKHQSVLIGSILNSLKLFTNESSLVYLESFIGQCDTTDRVEEIYLNKAKKIRKIILAYNVSIKSQEQLIETTLFSDDHNDVNWARAKIYQLKDISYLPLLKRYLNSTNRNSTRRIILELMQYLGEKDFEKEELLILEELERFNELEKARTLNILREPLSTRSVKDF